MFLVLLFFPAKLYAKTFSWKDYTSNVKKMQITSKNMQTLLNEMILKISEDCCEKNFQNKERLLLIKTNMNTCLEEDCHKKNFLFYKKKPQKLLVLEQIEEAKNLFKFFSSSFDSVSILRSMVLQEEIKKINKNIK